MEIQVNKIKQGEDTCNIENDKKNKKCSFEQIGIKPTYNSNSHIE